MKIAIKNARLAFPNLFKATTVNGGGEPAFSAAFLIPPDHPAVKEINDAAEKLGREKWGAKWAAIKKEIAAKDKMPLHDGDNKASYAGFEGMMYINARNKTRPLVLDRDKTPLTEQDGRPYAGCYVVGSIELWTQDNSYGKRINASLRGVQFYRDGEAFAGGGTASEDEFEDLGVDEEEEAPV
jgi:hypothetical protein